MTSLTTLPRNTNISLPGKKRLGQDPLICVRRDKTPVSTWREEQSPQVRIEKWQSSCVHVEGRTGPQRAQTRQNLLIHRGPVYTWWKEQGPLHKRKGGSVSLCTHQRGRVLVSTQGEGGERRVGEERGEKGRGHGPPMYTGKGSGYSQGFLALQRGQLHPAPQLYPVEVRSQRMLCPLPPSPPEHCLLFLPSLGKGATHRFSLLAFGPSSAREPLQDRDQGQVQG